MGVAGLLELGLDEFGVSDGGAKDGEALFCGGQGGGWPAPFQTLGKGRHHSVAGGHEERLLNL